MYLDFVFVLVLKEILFGLKLILIYFYIIW